MKTKGRVVAIILSSLFLLISVVSLVVITKNNEAIMAAVLRQGSRGTEVKSLQNALNKKGYSVGTADGIYGAKTKSAVTKFQKASGLAADGIAGSKTQAKLGMSSGSSSGGSSSSGGGSNSHSTSDVYLLAKTIYAEARGEPYTGKVAVGSVVLNRVKSSKFPNTIPGVVYQPWAFTAVNDGQINLTPNDECMRAAKDAINGWDPSYGCIYYYNPKTATSQWIFTTKKVTTIGRHVFAV